ncbi:MAG: amidohydrolase [Burkholderiales bacterium]|nr:amidohydrolase [Burkholderiales bacterium]
MNGSYQRLTPDAVSALGGFAEGLGALRREIHRRPETAFTEVETSARVAAQLRALGLEVHTGLATTGVVASLQGRRGLGRRIGLRADMDALFIDEANGFEHRSQVAGKMHACGHDGHTAMLIGAAAWLRERADFAGTVHFIFQPAEESEGGARVMIEQGLFERFPCDAVYGLHNDPGLEAGRFKIRSGSMMAAGDTWEVRFEGTGGHGAMPHKATDPTMVLATFLTGLPTIVARNVPATEAAVISIGHIAAGAHAAPNIIPSSVLVRGTARSYTAAVRDVLENRLRQLSEAAALGHGLQAHFKYIRRYPSLVNGPEQTKLALQAAQAVAGAGQVDAECELVGGSEDFAFMLQKVPGAYIMLGNGIGPNLHTPRYEFNDAIIPAGVAYWVNLVAAELGAA